MKAVLGFLFKLVAVLVGVPTGLMVATFFATATDRGAPLEVHSYQLAGLTVPRGGTLEGVWSVRVIRECSGHAIRRLESISQPGWFEPLDSIDYDLSEGLSKLPADMSFPITPIRVSANAPLGRMVYRNTTSFRCNSFGHIFFPIVINFPLLAFDVVERAG